MAEEKVLSAAAPRAAAVARNRSYAMVPDPAPMLSPAAGAAPPRAAVVNAARRSHVGQLVRLRELLDQVIEVQAVARDPDCVRAAALPLLGKLHAQLGICAEGIVRICAVQDQVERRGVRVHDADT